MPVPSAPAIVSAPAPAPAPVIPCPGIFISASATVRVRQQWHRSYARIREEISRGSANDEPILMCPKQPRRPRATLREKSERRADDDKSSLGAGHHDIDTTRVSKETKVA